MDEIFKTLLLGGDLTKLRGQDTGNKIATLSSLINPMTYARTGYSQLQNKGQGDALAGFSSVIADTLKPFRMGAGVFAKGYSDLARGVSGDLDREYALEEFIKSGLTPEELDYIERKPYMAMLKSGAGMAGTLMPFAGRAVPAATLGARTIQVGGRGLAEGTLSGLGYSREGKELQDTLLGALLGTGGELVGEYAMNPSYRQMVKEAVDADAGRPGYYGGSMKLNITDKDIKKPMTEEEWKIYQDNKNRMYRGDNYEEIEVVGGDIAEPVDPDNPVINFEDPYADQYSKMVAESKSDPKVYYNGEELRDENVQGVVDNFSSKWGSLEGKNLEPFEVKIKQGGDKLLNAESEWIMQSFDKMSPEKQKLAVSRIDEIINTIQDPGQRSQIEMIKKYLPAQVEIKQTYQKAGILPDTETVYHGTNTTFNEFDPSKINLIEGSGDYVGSGFYFTNDIEKARKYAKQAVSKTGGTENIIEATLDIKNPLIINNSTDSNKLYGLFGGEDSFYELMIDNPNEIAKKLQSLGYDGLVDNIYGQRAVFDPGKISIKKGSVNTNLLREAKKYNSPEEFVKAQGEVLYHGTTKENPIDTKDIVNLTPKDYIADSYALKGGVSGQGIKRVKNVEQQQRMLGDVTGGLREGVRGGYEIAENPVRESLVLKKDSNILDIGDEKGRQVFVKILDDIKDKDLSSLKNALTGKDGSGYSKFWEYTKSYKGDKDSIASILKETVYPKLKEAGYSGIKFEDFGGEQTISVFDKAAIKKADFFTNIWKQAKGILK